MQSPTVYGRERDVTVPMPTPTLPEIAALFLAMLLLGSGAYLLRRRQSGGLTPRRGLAGETPWCGVWHGCSYQHLLRPDGHHRDRPAADLFGFVVRGRVR